MRLICLYISLVIPLMLMGQKNKNKKISVEKAPTSTYYKFGKIKHMSFTKRLQEYPFNKAAQIKLVSFNYEGGQIEDTVYYNPMMPKLHYAICRFPFAEIKTINYIQVDSLSDIIYNYGYIIRPEIVNLTKCYITRNGILFLNEDGKVFEFIEICFACKKLAYSYHDKANVEDFERPAFKVLRGFFIKNGLEYGLTKLFEGQTMGNWDDEN